MIQIMTATTNIFNEQHKITNTANGKQIKNKI